MTQWSGYRATALFVSAGLATIGLCYAIAFSAWPKLAFYKGPEWFGEEAEAPVVDAATFEERVWTRSDDFYTYTEIRAKYQLRVGDELYEYPYNDGYAAVPLIDASADTIVVRYLPSDPSRNHPATMTWSADDPIAAMLVLIVLLQVALWVLSTGIYGVVVDEGAVRSERR